MFAETAAAHAADVEFLAQFDKNFIFESSVAQLLEPHLNFKLIYYLNSPKVGAIAASLAAQARAQECSLAHGASLIVDGFHDRKLDHAASGAARGRATEISIGDLLGSSSQVSSTYCSRVSGCHGQMCAIASCMKRGCPPIK